jgi:uncharacterized protein YfaP (DUF2135 family)
MWRKQFSLGLILLGLVLSMARCGGGGGTVTIAAPGGVALVIGDGQITITWNAVTGATKYHIYWKVNPGVTKQNSTKISNITVTNYTQTGLTNGTQYCYAVVAANAQTESNLSAEKCGTPAPAAQPPAPPANLRVVSVGDQTATLAWDPSMGATSYNLYMASEAGVTKANYSTKPDGMKHENVTSPFTHTGLTNGKTYYFVVTAQNAVGESGESSEVSATPQPPPPANLQVSGTVEWDTGGPVVGAACTYKLEINGVIDALFQPCGTTNAAGGYSFGADPAGYPARVLVQITAANSAPVVGTRWSTSHTGPGVVGMGRLILPDLRGAGMNLAGGTATRPDGTIRIDGVPGNVATIAAQSYDPGANPDAFPGEFMSDGGANLNSTVFLTVSAQDAGGNPVVNLPQPATIRVQIPQTQWVDLEDTQSGNGQIDIPIYSYDYNTGQWVAQPDGWLENASRQIIPEESEQDIIAGNYPPPIFAVLAADHFSWWNVDYPYIGPWTLSRLDRDKRNNKCLYDALKLAQKIAKSQKGRDAYKKVNQDGADLDVELADGQGPELKTFSPANDQEYGVYKGDSGGREDEIFINTRLWNFCKETSTENEKKAATLMMALTILHESAHWKDDVKKFPDAGDQTPPDGPKDTPGEEGWQWERDVFGKDLFLNNDGTVREGTSDGPQVDQNTIDGWLNPDNWPPAGGMGVPQSAPAQEPSPLELTLSMPNASFGVFDPIPVDVTYKNVGTAPIQVLSYILLEDYPVRFDITHIPTGKRVGFLGTEHKRGVSSSDFVTLNPNETLTIRVDLRYDDNNNLKRYNLSLDGQYQMQAVYAPFFGLPETTSSNPLSFFVSSQPPGSISGRVRDATNQNPIAGANVRAKIGSLILGSATTDGQGNYQITNLQPASYLVEAVATGYIRGERTGVVVNSGQDTGQTNFLLSPLLAEGEVRVVLGWGQDPRDLDSHLWLPTETRYHLYYRRRGSLTSCPWANLDQDVTSGFGPETITIKQRVATGTYQYAVYHYSGVSDIPNSGAQVSIYDARGLLATFTPNPGTGSWWHVFSMDGATGSITEINQMLDSYEPYPDTDLGCNPPDLNVNSTGNGTVTSNPAGINCGTGGSDCFEEYAVDTQVVLTATPDTGETFLGWGGDCSGTNPTCTLTMDADKFVYATFSGGGPVG